MEKDDEPIWKWKGTENEKKIQQANQKLINKLFEIGKKRGNQQDIPSASTYPSFYATKGSRAFSSKHFGSETTSNFFTGTRARELRKIDIENRALANRINSQ